MLNVWPLNKFRAQFILTNDKAFRDRPASACPVPMERRGSAFSDQRFFRQISSFGKSIFYFLSWRRALNVQLRIQLWAYMASNEC